MCLVKKPKPVTVERPKEKDPQVLRNPYLDGLDPIIRARSGGLKALRIDRTVPKNAPPSTVGIARPPAG